MKPLAKFALAALSGLLLTTTPARADEITDLLDQGTYYMQLSVLSLQSVQSNTARRDKCRWAHQSRNELIRAIEYYDLAERRAANNPGWTAADRQKLNAVVLRTREQLPKADWLIKEFC